MKKTVLFLISLLLSVTVCAAENFEVFRTSGVVQMYKDGQLVSVKKREPLHSADRLKLGTNSSIGIKDNKTKKIYYCSEPGWTKVLAIIVSAKNQSKSTTSLLTGTITSTTKGKPAKSRRQVHGAVIRGGINGRLIDGTETTDEDSVKHHPTYRNSFGNMLNDILSDKVELTESDSLSIGLNLVVAPEDSLLTYVITDRMTVADTMYVNVLRITPGEAPQLMFDGGLSNESVSITSDSELAVDWYPSVYDPSARYLLIVCEQDFNPNNVQKLLDRAYKSQKTEINQPAYIPGAIWNARSWVINSQLTMDN